MQSGQQAACIDFAASPQWIDACLSAGGYLPADLASARHKRQAEFLAGRCCAQRALSRLGLGRPLIPIGVDRAPQWPVPAVGAITHSDGSAAALVGLQAEYQAIGLDLETIQPATRAGRLLPAVMSVVEQHLAAAVCGDVGLSFTIVFSAKESLFKALYPLCGRAFYFLDAQLLALDPGQGHFVLQLQTALGPHCPRGQAFAGKLAFDLQRVMTALSVAAANALPDKGAP